MLEAKCIVSLISGKYKTKPWALCISGNLIKTDANYMKLKQQQKCFKLIEQNNDADHTQVYAMSQHLNFPAFPAYPTWENESWLKR